MDIPNTALNYVERRRSQRHELTIPLTIFAEDKNSIFGRAVNISTDGILIRTFNDINIEQQLSLWLELPIADLKTPPALIPMICVSKWSWQIEETDEFNLGCCFIEIDTESLAEILTVTRNTNP